MSKQYKLYLMTSPGNDDMYGCVVDIYPTALGKRKDSLHIANFVGEISLDIKLWCVETAYEKWGQQVIWIPWEEYKTKFNITIEDILLKVEA